MERKVCKCLKRMVDVTDHPYKEPVEAAKATNKRLFDVHAGKVLPFNQRPKASDAGTPASHGGIKKL